MEECQPEAPAQNPLSASHLPLCWLPSWAESRRALVRTMLAAILAECIPPIYTYNHPSSLFTHTAILADYVSQTPIIIIHIDRMSWAGILSLTLLAYY